MGLALALGMLGIQLEAEGRALYGKQRETALPRWVSPGGMDVPCSSCQGEGPSTPLHSRGIEPLHPSVVADAVGAVPQVVALVIDAVGRLLVGQVPLHLVLGRPVGSSTHKERLSLGTGGWDGFLPIPCPRSSQLGSDVLL